MNIEKKEFDMDFHKSKEEKLESNLRNLNGIVLLKHDSIEFTKIIQILNQIKPEHFIDVLYISFVRSYKYMRTAIEFNPLLEKRIFFIDCVSGYAFPDEDKIDDCLYHRPPSNIKEMEKVILFGIEKSNPDIVVIDSMSQYISFSKSNINDMIDLINFIKALNKEKFNLENITFIILYDTKMGLIKDLSPISDMIDDILYL
jgi:hypothetical protein